jgi:hypothetical protein
MKKRGLAAAVMKDSSGGGKLVTVIYGASGRSCCGGDRSEHDGGGWAVLREWVRDHGGGLGHGHEQMVAVSAAARLAIEDGSAGLADEVSGDELSGGCDCRREEHGLCCNGW